jgi:methylphosphotriester-DNA--protein-cysteine methyltransferase
MKSPKLYKNNSVVNRRMKLAEPVAETDLGKRILAALGPDDFGLLRTFQQQFGAKLVHYQDGQGEVGTRPGWVDEPR